MRKFFYIVILSVMSIYFMNALPGKAKPAPKLYITPKLVKMKGNDYQQIFIHNKGNANLVWGASLLQRKGFRTTRVEYKPEGDCPTSSPFGKGTRILAPNKVDTLTVKTANSVTPTADPCPSGIIINPQDPVSVIIQSNDSKNPVEHIIIRTNPSTKKLYIWEKNIKNKSKSAASVNRKKK